MTPTPETAGGLPVLTFLFTLALALVHLLTGRRLVTDPERRRRVLSAAGGASVAYVFVLLLPEVSEVALVVGELRGQALLAEELVYVVFLTGFVAFYGLEVLVTQRLGESVDEAPLVFWFHVVVFASYSGIIGYLLFHQERPGTLNLFFYTLAMALHFAVTDAGLRRHHGGEFDRVGRWLLVGGVLLGGAVGFLTDIGGLALAALFAFVSGAIVFNVVKEELPELSETRFTAFVAGAVVYTVVLLLT